MSARRRLSESISEGEAISLIVRVSSVDEAADAEAAGAEGLAATVSVATAIVASTTLPVLVWGGSAEIAGATGVAAWLLVAEEHAGRLEEEFAAVRELGLECVVDVHDDEELQDVLASVDPEIILLSPRSAEDDEAAVDRVLELLPDVPAGKLAVGELSDASGEDVLALERAGFDAVLVNAADLAAVRS